MEKMFKKHARMWVDQMIKQYGDNIKFSIENSKIYDREIEDFKVAQNPNKEIDSKYIEISVPIPLLKVPTLLQDESKINLILEPYDTVTATLMAKAEYPESKVAFLNFANYFNPGGGFLRGAVAQEESICHESTLYPVLSAITEYYEENNKNDDPIGGDRVLYSPGIVVIRDNQVVLADTITAAAPCLYDDVSISDQELYDIMYHRIGIVLDVAYANGVNQLILGAWGCGAFCCSPEVVSEAFYNAIKDRGYNMKYIFAILKSEVDNNLQVFFNTFFKR